MSDYYRIDDGDSNELSDGLSERRVWIAARLEANRLGQTVYVSGPDEDSTPVEPDTASGDS